MFCLSVCALRQYQSLMWDGAEGSRGASGDWPSSMVAETENATDKSETKVVW